MAAAVRSESKTPFDKCSPKEKTVATMVAIDRLLGVSSQTFRVGVPRVTKPRVIVDALAATWKTITYLGKVGSCPKTRPAATIQQPRENRRSVSFLRSPVQKSPEEAECGWRSHESTLAISRSIASQAVFLGFSMGFSAWA
jgi:hypothetical protein